MNLQDIFMAAFVVWSLPLGIYRSKFRKMVYQTDDWRINIKPFFLKELSALFGNTMPDDKEYLSLRNFYRVYLTVYLLLFACWQMWPGLEQLLTRG